MVQGLRESETKLRTQVESQGTKIREQATLIQTRNDETRKERETLSRDLRDFQQQASNAKSELENKSKTLNAQIERLTMEV